MVDSHLLFVPVEFRGQLEIVHSSLVGSCWELLKLINHVLVFVLTMHLFMVVIINSGHRICLSFIFSQWFFF